MSNHLHLIVRTHQPTLGRGMHRLHSLYAANFNERHGRVGHLFQNRYGSSRIWTCERLAYIRRYVTENPVSAGLCRTPNEWPWGSAAARAGVAPWWLSSSADIGAVYAVLADVPESVAA